MERGIDLEPVMAFSRLISLSALALFIGPSAPSSRAAGVERGGVAAQRGKQDQEKKKRDAPQPTLPRPRIGELDGAKHEALERNVPLIVIAIQEGEEANDRFYEAVYRHPSFVTTIASVVLLLVNDGDHPQRTLVEEGADGKPVERRVCERYETATCAEHKQNFNRVHQEFNEDGALRTPQMLVLAPQGELRERFVDLHGVDELTMSIAKAAQAAGPGLSAEQLQEVKKRQAAASGFQRALDWSQAYREWQALLAVASAGAFAEEAKAGAERALGQLRADMDKASAAMQAGKVVDGYVALVKLGLVLAGTPLEKDHKKALQAAERNKDWRPAIEAHKRAVEADGLWQEIETLLAAEQAEKALRVGERILRRFADTPAAERVRQQWPDLEQSLQEKP